MSSPGRVVAVDVARYAALLGIMVNHVWGTGLVARLLWDLHAIAFTWLVGVGTAYAVAPAEASGRRRSVGRALVRAGVLAAAGWTLEDLQAGTVSVVLVRMALITGLAALLALLPDRWLPGVAAGLWLLTPVAGWLLMAYAPALFDATTGWRSLLHPGTWPYLLFHPYYPALPWLGVAVLGLWTARRVRFDDPQDMRRLALGGATLALVAYAGSELVLLVAGRPVPYHLAFRSFGEYPMLTTDWRWLLGVGAYLPSAPSLAVSTGLVMTLSALVAGACLRLGRRRWLDAVGAVGSMTLSAYFAHVLLTRAMRAAAQRGWLPAHTGDAGALLQWASQVVLLSGLLWAWHRFVPGRVGRGPLEWLSRAVASAMVR